MCMNLSLAHVAGRVTDGGGGRHCTGDGPLSPPRPGWSQKFAQRENACHPCAGRQGRHCRVRAEAQDISRNQEMPAPRLAPPPSDCPRAKATLPKPSQAGRRPLPPHSPSPAALWPGSQTCMDSLRGQALSASASVQPVGCPSSPREGRG